jgi:hypothetical protein
MGLGFKVAASSLQPQTVGYTVTLTGYGAPMGRNNIRERLLFSFVAVLSVWVIALVGGSYGLW